MDRSVEVRTPESVAFAYQLAGLGSRFLAVIVDITLQYLLILALFFGLAFVADRLARLPGNHTAPSHFAANVGIGIVLFVLFMILFGYFILFEAFWNGQTPGKKLLGIRVLRDGGYPIDFTASLIRNLIRVGEELLGFYLLAAISALISSENKRIGDYAAGTIVVRDARLPAPSAIVGDLLEESSYAATNLLAGGERELVHRFIERRETLPAAQRAQFAAQLAARVRPRVGPELARLDDESLLERL
ncbi:MAG TPA: RDD family protein [Candidatus Tyrphobacter sp.]